jgi:hypothetical protein
LAKAFEQDGNLRQPLLGGVHSVQQILQLRHNPPPLGQRSEWHNELVDVSDCEHRNRSALGQRTPVNRLQPQTGVSGELLVGELKRYGRLRCPLELAFGQSESGVMPKMAIVGFNLFSA